MKTNLKDSILERLKKLPGKISFFYKNMKTGEVLSFQDDTPMQAASVIKLFIMTEAYRQIRDGELDRNHLITVHRKDCVPSCGAIAYMHEGIQVTAEDLYTLMIILSDNSATNYLIDLLGADSVNAGIRKLGFQKTELKRKMYDTEKSARGIQNIITASETGRLLEMMYQGELISPEASADMIRIMKEQQINGKIPFYIEAIPDHADIAHKTGEDDGVTHDAAILFTKQPFILVFCGNETDVPAFERVMAEISLELYRENEN